ncbi:hypothetical protein DPMN_063237 [Dreissena polymorpha]|uniref:Uncharacterized protein n=1 Tax=Dreissena polymorpha TaxID=45954 RepID=A0A9D4CAL6_DREPO|nr:hypothetical protein DPMN_063237 [Dreissena polymorpha]
MSCSKKIEDFYNSSLIKWIRFIFFLGLNILNIVFVWLLFYSVAVAKEGLVFGNPGNLIKYSLLSFIILDTLSFPSEVYFDWQEIMNKFEDDAYRAATIWLSEFPQMVINCVIVACREEANSNFLLVKASVIALAAIMRILVFILKRCIKVCDECISCFLRLLDCVCYCLVPSSSSLSHRLRGMQLAVSISRCLTTFWNVYMSI